MTRHISHLGASKIQSSHAQIARILGVEILTGVYPPGANLPPEPVLLSRFQISRTALREVVKTLAAKGLVLSKTRVGTRVLDPVNWNYFDADVLAWKVSLGMDETFRRNLAEIRRALEPQAAALAAERRTLADLVELSRCIAAMRAPGQDARSFAQADLEFHLAVGAASGNPMMRSMAALIETALLASFSLGSPTTGSDLQESVVDAHEAILNAIASRRKSAAAKAMLNVIQVGFDRVESQVSTGVSPPPSEK